MSLKWLVTLSVFLVIGNHGDAQDVRVKLCGREFIRMVVTSCGSSRLRRSTLDINHTHFSTHVDKIVAGLSSGQVVNLMRLQTFEDIQQLDDGSSETGTENGSAVKITEGSGMAPDDGQSANVSIRTVRDVGPAGVCCRSGCTMSELVQYC
ncbi:insulin-like 3 (Leydig cell) isoform X1 [Pygocentrus nattereri]|uniref:insulin-like 3 (Leydig cell) isoform X1 n=1 Tax=Pygocentrus nattereri TaxID=42514 RepID=UPI001891A944|nr:insulin-like 3 (Leydig cell) isoform X1 [Pygocentrus nattereri]